MPDRQADAPLLMRRRERGMIVVFGFGCLLAMGGVESRLNLEVD